MHEQIDQQEKDIIAELPNLNPDQQTTVVEYWENATTFLTSIFSYLKTMFNYVIDAIKKGLKIAKDAFKQMFDEVKQWLEDVLNLGRN
ncbi:unnamed protein product [Brachionus calyciflorus]|uniref:Uncharacterized protein n=1 Tax=Brachionus calyciflorus TaxID=104777 RepID=A0A814L000_9BILA|nr:unnamed protein product [Brachionus calyciflorus]